MADLAELVKVLTSFPVLQNWFSTTQMLLFIDLACHLRREIDLNPSNNPATPPLHLPKNVQLFLSLSVFGDSSINSQTSIDQAWDALGSIVWTLPERKAAPETLPLFLEHGPKQNIAWHTVGPPTTRCLNPSCADISQKLSNRKHYPAMLFSHDHGPLPVFPSNLYCERCHTTYHSNYYIHSDATARTYYDQVIPEFIHISQRFFMEEAVCEMFANMMVMTWSSATNCARVYNLSIGDYTRKLQTQYRLLNTEMTMDHVWDAFFLHGLILDGSRSNDRLTLPNNEVEHQDRYSAALQVRNLKYQGPMRDGWNHCCDTCSHMVARAEGNVLVRAAVIDGITIGHPCCAIHDCKVPLESQRHRYCPQHQDWEHKCAVEGCIAKAKAGSKSCGSPICSAAEAKYQGISGGNAMFQLKNRLSHQRERLTGKSTPAPFLASYATPLGPDSVHGDDQIGIDGEVEVEVDNQNLCKGKTSGKSKVKARFGRRRTHNDELCVNCCGIIVGRTTCYGSEGVNGVRDFLHNIYPTISSLPSYIFFDNNCQLLKMLLRRYPRDYLLRIGLPVDVFHFECKHTEKDEFCQQNCNPAQWEELMENGKWVFNSSVAEQTNAWYGGFLAIAREMRQERYNFFLDEMIRRRNNWTLEDLRKKAKNPRLLRYDILLGDLEMDE